MNVRVLTALTLALAVALAGCGDTTVPDGADGDDTPTGSPAGDGDGSPGTTDEVSIEALAFAEQEITVPAGTTVTWVNNDSVGHTVTHGEDGQPASDAMFDEAIGVGEEVTFTFDEPGTYQVTCTIHPQMNMTVVVDG